MTSQMLLELDLTKYGLGIIANLVMGALSAVVSRRVVMLVPLFGYLIRCVIIFLVVFLALDVNWLFAGYAVDGIMGSVNGIYFATYLYTSEITSRDKSRTLALAILESVKGAVTAAVYVVTGQLIQHTGYNWPAILSAACTLLAVVLAFALPPRPPRPSPTAVTKSSPLLPTPVEGYWDKMKTPFKQGRQKGLTALVTLACLAFFLDRISDFMVAKVRTLYVMNQPFCWSSSQIGWFDSGTQMACYLFTMVSVCLFARYLSGGVSVAIPAVLSAAGGHCVYAFATDDIELYAAPVLGMSSSLSSCLLRGETSRALGPQAQGPWFAVIAVIESLSFTLGTPALAVYRASLGFFRGLVFLIAAGLLLCEIFLLLAFQLKWRKFISRKGQTIVVPSATEDPDPKE
ncbi:proton-coupled folate transporter [Aplysia californica]|uniref:Proton-coupled folate transporter n=1 Tax=Aplysia californica TaxID=6500 RepID=A0ABM1A9R7_APLCA|nr:proton-coupled folate transporter [Aplysia californica]